MGVLTDHGSATLGISREYQDHIATQSHQRAAHAQDTGVFQKEIAPVTVRTRRGEETINADEGLRPDTTEEALARLRPAFTENGTITAGNASPLSDGAAAVLLASKTWAEQHGVPIMAELVTWAHTAGPDTTQLHHQPSRAIKAALTKANLTVTDLVRVEINEAFAAVSAASMDALGIGDDKVSIHGGAITLGHPVGASGARLVAHLAHTLGAGELAAAALCGGSGQGDALILRGR